MYTDYMSEKNLPGINYFDYLRGMQSVVQENGYQLLIDTITPRQIAERQLPSMLTKGYVEGIIYNGLVNIDYLTFFVEKCPNTVVLGRADDLKLQQVETDNYYGGELVAEYLWKLGHRHFAIMSGVKKNVVLAQRQTGFEETLARLSGGDCRIDVLRADYWKMDGGSREIAAFWQKSGTLPTAVFGLNDHLALNVLIKLKEMGVKVPETVSVIGFDNVDKGTVVTPHLSTISIPRVEIGQLAAEKMIALLSGRITQKHEISLLKPTLIKRNSCRALMV